MANKKPEGNLAQSARALQENAERAGPAAGASYTLIGAIVLRQVPAPVEIFGIALIMGGVAIHQEARE